MGPVYSFNQIAETQRQADMERGLDVPRQCMYLRTGVLARIRRLRSGVRVAALVGRLGRDYPSTRKTLRLVCAACGGRDVGVLVAPPDRGLVARVSV